MNRRVRTHFKKNFATKVTRATRLLPSESLPPPAAAPRFGPVTLRRGRKAATERAAPGAGARSPCTAQTVSLASRRWAPNEIEHENMEQPPVSTWALRHARARLRTIMIDDRFRLNDDVVRVVRDSLPREQCVECVRCVAGAALIGPACTDGHFNWHALDCWPGW